MSYTTETSKTYSYSSRSGQPAQSTRTETRTYIDADGTRRTETVTYGSDGSRIENQVNNLGQQMNRGVVINAPISPSRSKTVESRYSRGWSGSTATTEDSLPTGESFAEIRRVCLRAGRLFEDPDFPAINSSLFTSRAPPRPFVWKRPKEICEDPQLFVGGASRFDINQGMLGDCWLLAAVASLTTQEALLHRVVPSDQGFGDGYAGCFYFRFWRFGTWKEVVIDDRLPTYDNKLVFMNSPSNNEFWSALLEKAYAKMCGSYEALKGGQTSEAMEDFTGGLCEILDLKQEENKKCFPQMLQAQARNSLMGCSIEAKPNEIEALLDNGLVKGHAYSITSVKLVDIQTRNKAGKIPLVRIRNPWGNEKEWEGAWSDKSPEWNFLDDSERRKIGLTFDNDGEFWMSFTDFVKHFTTLEMCHLGASGVSDDHSLTWHSHVEQGAWTSVSAGGCRNFIDTFAKNPQYRVSVQDTDDDEDDLGTLIVALMQKERRVLKKRGEGMLTIGYAIYKLDDAASRGSTVDKQFFMYNASAAKSPSFINSREVCGRHKLTPGEYCIIPSTFNPNEKGKFVLRIFSEKPAPSREMDEETEITDQPNREGGANSVSGMNRPRPRTQPPKVPSAPGGDGGRPRRVSTEEERAADDQFYKLFKKLSGPDEEIDAQELKQLLSTAFNKELGSREFNTSACKSIIANKDDDKSGKINFSEFKELWMMIRQLKQIFHKHDKDNSGSLEMQELRQSLRDAGISVSNGTLVSLVVRYEEAGKMTFDAFVHVIVKLKTLFKTFEERKKPNGKAEFGLDEFIQTTMYT